MHDEMGSIQAHKTVKRSTTNLPQAARSPINMQPSKQEITRVRKLAISVHRTTWNEYFIWEEAACTRVLQHLRTDPFTQYKDMFPVGEEETTPLNPEETSHLVLLQKTFVATDPYESCSPTYTQILHGDDPNDMPFMPYADDHVFKHADYTAEHSYFAWQLFESKTDGQ